MPKKINSEYQAQIEQIKIDGENYTEEEMKPIYSLQKATLENMLTFVGSLYIANSVDGILQLNQSKTVQIKAQIKDKLKTMGKDLGQAEVEKVTDILTFVYSDTYYKNAFILDDGLKIDLKFNLLKKEFVDAAVNQKFKDELFSDRIWKNKSAMIDKLHNSLIEAINGKTTIDKTARQIRDTFNVQAYESQRLVRTESARMQTQASEDIARNTGVKEVMWSATLDNKTNPEDASLDGKRWSLDEDHPLPPLHPNCRCVLINVPFADWQPTKRKDNEDKTIIDYQTYDQWKQDKGIN